MGGVGVWGCGGEAEWGPTGCAAAARPAGERGRCAHDSSARGAYGAVCTVWWPCPQSSATITCMQLYHNHSEECARTRAGCVHKGAGVRT